MSRASEYARDVNSILQNKANAIAEGKRASGQILGNTIATIGAVVPQQVQAVMKAQAEKRKTAQIQGIFQKHGDDLPSAIGEVMQIDPELGMDLTKRYQDAATSAFNYKTAQWKAKKDELDWMNNLIGSATDQDSYTQAIVTAKLAGHDVSQLPPEFSPEIVNHYNRALLTAKERLEMDKPKAPEAFTLTPGAKRFDATGKEIAAVPYELTPDQKADNERQAAAAKQTEAYQNAQLDISRGNLAVRQREAARAAGSQAADITHLTPSGLDMAALNYRKTGVMPPLGMGDRSTRQQIINRASELTPADMQRIEAGGADLAMNRADYKADSGSLTKLTAQRNAITSFENTAKKNIDVFLTTAGKVVDTGSPMANSLARAVSGKMLGSPDQAAYDAARQVAINEVAKIITNPNLAGTLSDAARHEVEAFNPANATLKQSVQVMRLLKQDMDNRTRSLDDQIKEIRGRIGSPGARPAGGGADPLGIR